MRLIFNATDGPLSLRAIRRYMHEMVVGLGHPSSGIELDLVFFTHRLMQVHRFLKKLPAETRYRSRLFPVPRRILNRRYRTPRPELRRIAEKADLWHETTSDHPAVDNVPLLTTFHGLCPMIRPDICTVDFVRDKTRWFKRALRVSDYYTTVSETCRGELVDNFEVDPGLVRAIPLGVSAEFHRLPESEVRAEIGAYFAYDSPYLLYVGGIQKNKNIPLVLRVFRRLREQKLFRGDLVLAGDFHYSPEEFTAMTDREGITGQVRTPGCFDPDDPRLAALYRGATLFLFPSFYEGWTSPPLEAMASGTPVIASRASSIPETVGDGGCLVDPADEESWVTVAAEILDSPVVYQEWVEAGIARAAQFPWKRCVDAHIQLYHDICAGEMTAQQKDPISVLSGN